MRNIASKGSCQHRPIADDVSVSKGFTARKDLWRNWQVLIFVTDWWHHTHSTTLESIWFLRGCVGLSVLYTYDHWLCLCQEGQESCGNLKPSNTEINFPRWWPQWELFGSLFLSGLMWLQRLLLYFCYSLLQINLSLLGDSWRKCRLLLKPLDGYGAHIQWTLK